eukprot:6276241-Alexandrium_andersonii.AAC.1
MSASLVGSEMCIRDRLPVSLIESPVVLNTPFFEAGFPGSRPGPRESVRRTRAPRAPARSRALKY